MEPLTCITETFTDHPARDVGISHALLEAVAKREIGSIFRLHVPRSVLAFGMADRIQPGYRSAVRMASAHGFSPIERLAGGRAAVFHGDTLAFSWATHQNDASAGIKERFVFISELLNATFRGLGLDTRIGEVRGEYCPGEYSINVGGLTKVMGVGQRLVKGAAHVGGVIVVDDAKRIRDVLIPVYRALGIDWDPRTTGALADKAPGLDTHTVSEEVVLHLKRRFDVIPGHVPESVVNRAVELTENHVPKVA